MGWFWGSSNDASTPDNRLDPSLRDFLEKETAARQQPASTATAEQNQQHGSGQKSYRSQMGITQDESRPAQLSLPETKTSVVPQESLYQDGRYAHLWKTYQPLSSIEGSQRTEQDRLTDVIDTYNDRKAMIGRAAVENCVFEQLAEHDCFKRGGMYAKMTMCRDENKAFNRCYQMQSRFLKALGYLGTQRTEEEEEKIQMHADKLYHEMLAREEAINKAKKDGNQEPVFAPLLNNASAAEAMGIARLPDTRQSPTQAIREAQSKPLPTDLPKKEGLDIYAADKRKDIEKRLAGMNKAERELEIQLIVAESHASVEYAQKIRDYYEGEKAARVDRKERGRETFGDSIKRLWGWDR